MAHRKSSQLLLFAISLLAAYAEYIAIQITPSSYIINAPNTYSFKLNRGINPTSFDFIDPIAAVPVGSIIEIVFPIQYISISSSSNPTCRNANNGASLSCTVDEGASKITIEGYYSSTSTATQSEVSIAIDGILNPNRAGNTDNFEYYIKQSDGTIIDESPASGYDTSLTFEGGAFAACAISANNFEVLTGAKYTFTLTPSNPISASGKIVINLPKIWDDDIDSTSTITSASLTCTPISGISGSFSSCTYTLIPSPININRITVTLPSTATVSSAFSFSVSSILTPPYINNPQQVSMESQWNDGTIIDSCQSTVQDVVATSFQAISFISTSNTVVQSTFQGRLEVTLKKPFHYQDSITFEVPSNFISATNQINITSSNFPAFVTNVDVSTYTVTLTSFSGSAQTLPANNILTFFFNSIRNHQSVEPQTITATCLRNSEEYQRSSASYQATSATLTSFTIQSDNTAVNSFEPAKLILETSLTIPVGSYIQLVYHSSISTPNLAATAVTSASIQGVLVTGVTYSVSSNTITIFNLFATTGTGTIEIILPALKNPPTVKPIPYSLSLKSSTNYLIATSSYTYTAALQSFVSITNQVASSSYTVMQDSVTYTVTFVTNYGFKAVSILIPTDVEVVAGFESSCSPNTFTSCSMVQLGDGRSNLTFIGTAAAGSHSLSWGNNVNPNSYLPTGTFEVYTYSSGWGVEKSSGYVTLTMNTAAVLESSLFTPSSKINNQVISISIQFTLPAESPSGTVTMMVPTDLDISSAVCSLAGCVIVAPKVTIPFTNTDTSSSHSFSLTLSNVINAPSYKPISDFTISLKSTAGFNSISDTSAAWTNNAMSTFSTVVTSTDGFRAESAIFTFSLSGLTGKQEFVNIKISSLFQELTSAPTGATLISGYEVRYDITGESEADLSFALVTPTDWANLTFSLRTYDRVDGSDYAIGKSTSNVWEHTCFGTECRDCDSSENCINCYDKSVEPAFYIFSTADQACIRACESGFYQTPADECIPCHTNCKECVEDDENCTACPDGWYLDTVYEICVQSCEPTYYANDLNNECMECVGTCNECSSETVCINCIENYYLLEGECRSTCPAGIMVKKELDRTCVFCDENCLTCQTYTYRCTSCNTSLDLYLDNNECVQECSTNLFIVDGVCTPCALPCKICHNTTTTCSSCYANETLSLWYNYQCISPSQCAIGHYVNSVNGSCDQCPSECEQCSSLLNCSYCTSGYYLYGWTCKPVCPNDTYENSVSRTCDDCALYGCETCEIDGVDTICTSCDVIEYIYAAECYRTCPSHTYGLRSYETVTTNGPNGTNITEDILLRGECFDCEGDCATCINSTYCRSCQNQTLLYKGICYEECPTNTYENSNGIACTKCPTTCATCTSETNCLTCQTGYSLENSMCVLNCAQGFSYQQVCYACGLNCANCLGTTCQQCDNSTYLLNGRCYDDCPETTLIVNGSECRSCSFKYINCTTCDENECFTCADGQLLNGTCQPCSEGFYSRNSQCTACPSACTICENNTHCSSCSEGFYEESNYCVSKCPSNKFTNGSKCDVCVSGCSVCQGNTGLCEICVGGIYQFEGDCLTECPEGYMINLNRTLCVTPEDYALEYSKASKKIYFPFTIAAVIMIVISIILKCYEKSMHLATFLVSVLSWLELASWILFGIVEYLFYMNQQLNGLKGIITVLVAVGALIITDIVFLKFYYRYFSTDMDFIKWEKKHACANGLCVALGTAICFKIHRMVYSRVMDREQFSMVLSSPKKLIPISVLSVISIFVSSVPLGVGAAMALYNSLTIDQEFIAALDTLIVTGIMIILLLLDLKHAHNYFIDELETQNIKNKMYQEEDEKFSFENKSDKQIENPGNVSRQNLLQAENQNDLDYVQTTKKFYHKGNSKEERPFSSDEPSRTAARQGSNSKIGSRKGEEVQASIDDLEIDEISYESEERIGNKWVAKEFDQHGYRVVYDEHNNPMKYDEKGNRVEIDEDGNHHKYDEEGYEIKTNSDGEDVRYDADGLIVGSNGQRYDERGYQVKKNEETGEREYFDEHGYRVVEDPDTGELMKVDENGYFVKIDPETKEHKKYNKDGYLVKQDPKGNEAFWDEESGKYVRKNGDGNWEMYDPTDGFLWVKKGEGEYQKVDEHGFKIEKDQYGNIYRYDAEGYRVILDKSTGAIKRYDSEGYEIRKDPATGEITRYDEDGFRVQVDEDGNKKFYDEHGYRIERDFYGNVERFDGDGNLVIIDPKTHKHHRYNSEGLEICEDENGNRYLKDKRGKKVVELEDGFYEKYDEKGEKVWLDEEGCQVETDEHGNVQRYDKIGDRVEEEGEGSIDWEQDEDGGVMANVSKKEEKRVKRGFKKAKEFNFQEEYQKMLEQDKPQLIFDYEEESEGDDDDLKQFHDAEPVESKELEKEYQTLFEREREGDFNLSNSEQMKLEDLNEIDHTPYVNLREKNKRAGTQGDDDNLDENKQTIDPDRQQQKHEIKSVADVSINERSFENDGVRPITQRSENSDDLESMDEVNLNHRMMKKRKNKKGMSEMSFEQSQMGGETKSENNFTKNENNVEVQIKGNEKKIYDSDEEVASLGEEEWENDNEANIFYKDNQSGNANTNTHDYKGLEFDDQEDILSDYIPNDRDSSNKKHKASEENLVHRKYMQSIEEVEDELFDRLKSEDRKVKRTEFTLSGTPNPLLEYAKTIDNKKAKDRYTPVMRR